MTIEELVAAHRTALRLQEEMAAAAAVRDALVARALESGMGAVEVAEALGVHRSRVYQMARNGG